MAGGGFTLCFIGLTSLRRYLKFRGRFIFLDGTYLWEVGLYRIRVVELSPMAEVQERFFYRRTIVVYSLAGQRVALASTGEHIRKFILFSQACVKLRRQRNGSPPGMNPSLFPFIDHRGGLAYFAKQLVNQTGLERVRLKWSEVIAIPTPGFIGRQKRMPAWLVKPAYAGAVAFALGLLIALPIHPFLDERYQYAAVAASSQEDVNILKAYLAAFPNGKHAADVKILLDDRTYFVAGRQHSAAAMRDYLANASNVLHRDEAARAIDKYYDEAVDHVRELAEARAGDKPLLEGLLALLKNLKAKGSPVVYLGFVAHWTVTPNDPEAQVGEANAKRAYIQQYPEIQLMSEISPELVPIDPSAAFTERQIRRRQGIILQRVRDAFGKILPPGLIDFEPGRNATNCEIIVEYDIHPAGKLRLYSQRPETNSYYGISQYGAVKTMGLLRDYEISWQVRLRPQISGPAYEFSVTSNPGQQLRMTSTASDPAWAPYAVTLYSTFYDFSGELVESAGLNAPPAPTNFRFEEAVGSGL